MNISENTPMAEVLHEIVAALQTRAPADMIRSFEAGLLTCTSEEEVIELWDRWIVQLLKLRSFASDCLDALELWVQAPQPFRVDFPGERTDD